MKLIGIVSKLNIKYIYHMNKIALIFISLFISSCSVHFTKTMKNELERNNVKLSNVQFYNSSSFALQREVSSSETIIDKGRIKVREGKQIEIVQIRDRTPAICESLSDETLYIIFEHGDNKRIPFRNDNLKSYYSLVTSTNTPLSIKNYTNIPGLKFYGTIMYDGKEYYIGFGDRPKLKIKRKELEKVLKETRTVDGIRIR